MPAAVGSDEWTKAWEQKAQAYGGNIQRAMEAERGRKQTQLPLADQLAQAKQRYSTAGSQYQDALSGGFDLTEQLRTRQREDNPARAKFQDIDRSLREQLQNTASLVHTDEKFQGLSPQEKQRIIQEKQSGIAKRLDSNQADLEANTQSIEDLIGGIDRAYAQQGKVAEGQLATEQSYIDQLMAELGLAEETRQFDLNYALQAGAAGGGGGGYGSYGDAGGGVAGDVRSAEEALDIILDPNRSGEDAIQSAGPALESYLANTVYDYSPEEVAGLREYGVNRLAQLESGRSGRAAEYPLEGGAIMGPKIQPRESAYQKKLKQKPVSKNYAQYNPWSLW